MLTVATSQTFELNECVCPVGYLWMEKIIKGQFSRLTKYEGVENGNGDGKWNSSPGVWLTKRVANDSD